MRGKLPWALLIISALCINFAAVYVLSFVWKLNLLYHAAFVFIISLIAGLLIRDPLKSIVYPCLSAVLGLVMGLGILLTPPLIHGHSAMIGVVISVAFATFVRLLILGGGLAMCFVGGIAGSFLGEVIFR